MNKLSTLMFKFFVASLALIISFNVFACSCISNSLIENWRQHQHVFVADVTDIEVIEKAQSKEGELALGFAGVEHAAFKVETTFKGNPELITRLEAVHKPICCMCQTKLEKTKYLVFANGTGVKSIGSCSPTRKVKWLPYHEEVLHLLKNNVAPQGYTGIYDARHDTFLMEEEQSTTVIHQFRNQSRAQKLYLDIQAYPLNNGELFFIELNSETVLE